MRRPAGVYSRCCVDDAILDPAAQHAWAVRAAVACVFGCVRVLELSVRVRVRVEDWRLLRVPLAVAMALGTAA